MFVFQPAFYACMGQCITTFPYTESFESGAGGWTSGGTFNDWALGTPSKPVISSAASGNKCWITGGLSSSFYNYDQRSYVQSPCFDFSTLANPHISFYVSWETEYQYDGASFQYSINGGSSWSNVGAYGDVTDCLNQNWFNYASINNLSTLANPKGGWSGTLLPTSGNCIGGNGSGGWLPVKHSMPSLAGQSNVMFRFVFGAGTLCNDYDGFAFDQVVIRNNVPLTLTSNSTTAGCATADGTAMVNVSGGAAPYNYLWSPPVSTTAAATALTMGTYSVTVADAAGCNAETTIQVTQSPGVAFALSCVPDTCNGSKGSVSTTVSNGTAPYTYLWSNTTQSISAQNNLQTGNYSLIVTDSRGCSAMEFFDIGNISDLSISLGSDTIICPGTIYSITPGSFSDYTWQDLTGDPVFNVKSGGIYFVEVTDSRGCTASDTLQIVEDCLQDILLPGSFSPNDDGVNDFYLAAAAHISIFEMKIYNRWGQLVFISSEIENGWDGRKKNKKAPPGIYVVSVDYSVNGVDMLNKTRNVFLAR